MMTLLFILIVLAMLGLIAWLAVTLSKESPRKVETWGLLALACFALWVVLKLWQASAGGA